VALASATIGLVLGTMAGFALARYRRFRGRSLFSGLIAAPLVLPDVIAGLSLLLLFVTLETAIGWPRGRGPGTIVLAHATLATAYVAVVVQARLAGFDRSLEEAALDLGAPPWKAFARVTLPLIAPGLVAAWLLAFTLSLDDLVIASFVSGPGASTLPMVVFSKVRLGLNPEINALAALVVAVVGLGIFVAGRIAARRESDRGPSLDSS
jgi:putrescine transport system permease protein